MGSNPIEDAPEARRIGMKPSFPGAILRRTCSAAGLLAGSLIPVTARAAGAPEGFDLRLPQAISKFDLVHSALPLSLALLVITVYAATISIFHVRARRLWNEHFEEQNRMIRDAQAQAERSSNCSSHGMVQKVSRNSKVIPAS